MNQVKPTSFRAKLRNTALAVSTALVAYGCDGGAVDDTINFSTTDVVARGNIHSLALPGGSVQSLPANAPVQDKNKVELGRLLFWDPVLSGEQDVACATCHLPQRGYTDQLDLSIGVGGSGQGAQRSVGHVGFSERNAQTILNTSFSGIDETGNFDKAHAPMFWDARKNSLETQALEPLKSETEMRGDVIAEDDVLPLVIARLNGNTEYQTRFQQAYGVNDITEALLADALATFQRTLVANNSPFDRWMRGDGTAMSNNQLIGMREFVGSGCIKCHSGPMFSDYELHVLGVAENSKRTTPDKGDGQFAFRTPPLRNLSLTAPYMHNGRFNNLRDVVGFYDDPDDSENDHVSDNQLDPDFTSIGEMEGERLDRIVDFLGSLDDDQFDKRKPDTVPSQLTPGGNI